MKNKSRKNPLLDMPRAGPTECARLFGWSSPQTFKRHLPDLSPIRAIALLRGTFYILEDVFAARYPTLESQAVRAKLVAYLEDKQAQQSSKRSAQWIGPAEAGRLMGYVSAVSFKSHLRQMPKIRSRDTRRGRLYELRSVFASIYPEAGEDRLDELIIDYKKRRAQDRLRKIRRRQNEHSEKA